VDGALESPSLGGSPLAHLPGEQLEDSLVVLVCTHDLAEVDLLEKELDVQVARVEVRQVHWDLVRQPHEALLRQVCANLVNVFQGVVADISPALDQLADELGPLLSVLVHRLLVVHGDWLGDGR